MNAGVHLPTWATFQLNVTKAHHMTVRDMWGLMLSEVPSEKLSPLPYSSVLRWACSCCAMRTGIT